MVVPGLSDTQEEARKTVARVTMQEIRDTIANRYLQDMQKLPQPDLIDSTRLLAVTSLTISSTETAIPQMHFLFVAPRFSTTGAGTPSNYVAVNDFDSSARIGWNGPYIGQKSTTYPNSTLVRNMTSVTTTTGNVTWADCGFTTQYGQTGDFCVMDPWGSPYVIIPRVTTHAGSNVYSTYVVSAGFNRDARNDDQRQRIDR